jgi:uncharacterized protein involved in response to NO
MIPISKLHAPTGATPIHWRWLFAAPHRLFFFLGATGLALVSAWWCLTLMARQGLLPALGAGAAWHPVFMAFGFMPFFIFGFAFTAGPRWLQMPPVATALVRTPALLMAASLAGTVMFDSAIVFAGYLVGFGWLAARFARMVQVSPAPDKVHARLVVMCLMAGAAALMVHIGSRLAGVDSRDATRALSIWGFLAPLFCVVCHRMLPFFTASALSANFHWRPWWLLGALVGAVWVHGAMEWAGLSRALWAVDLPAAILAGAVVWRWGLMQSLANRLLAMLHLGFVWLAIAFALSAARSLLLVAGIDALGQAPVHALTIGFLCSLMLAMVTRVTLGHSGRTLAADRFTWAVFVMFQLVAVLRVLAEVLPSAYSMLILAAALLWCACLLAWAGRNAGIYLTPRADGQPG